MLIQVLIVFEAFDIFSITSLRIPSEGVTSVDTAPVEKETKQKREAEVTTNTVQEKIESDTKTEEEVSVEDSTRGDSEAELDKGEVKAEPAQTQEETEAASSGQNDTVETNSEKNTND